jgi:hypothetical protein
MNKLLVQNLNTKFINNIKLSKCKDYDQLVIDTSNQLYKIYYSYRFTHAIFVDSLLKDEEIQFINEFSGKVICYIYSNQNNTLTNCFSQKVSNIPTLVNNDIFYNQNCTKQENIVSFLDNIDSLPTSINSYLYPNSKLSIKLFNNSNIIHPQNLGLLSEQDKALLLQQNMYYLAINDYYVAEAWACGCTVLVIEDLESLTPSKYKHSKNFQSYSNFLKVLLSAKT